MVKRAEEIKEKEDINVKAEEGWREKEGLESQAVMVRLCAYPGTWEDHWYGDLPRSDGKK